MDPTLCRCGKERNKLMKQTLVIGSAVADVIVRIPHLPKTQEDIHISSQKFSLGGCAYLVSDILRHFQVPYSLCTAVGGNLYGDFVKKELEKRGVPIYVSLPQEKNGCCYCMVEDGGERTFIVEHGIEYTFWESYLEKIDTASVDSVYICGLEIEEHTGDNIIAYLEKHPDYTIYFAPGPRILSIPKERIERLFCLRPVLHLNEQEALSFTGEETVKDAAKAIFAMTQSPVIVTLGKQGAYAYLSETEDIFAPAYPARVEDTIGAGDSHIGAVIAARRLGFCWQEVLMLANRISAAVVEQAGGTLREEAFAEAKKEFFEK